MLSRESNLLLFVGSVLLLESINQTINLKLRINISYPSIHGLRHHQPKSLNLVHRELLCSTHVRPIEVLVRSQNSRILASTTQLIRAVGTQNQVVDFEQPLVSHFDPFVGCDESV